MLILSLTVVPGTFLLLYFSVNVVLWIHASSAGLSAPMVVAVFGLWAAHSVLVVVGMLVGFRMGAVPYPLAINNIPRFIPTQPWYNNRFLVFFCAGLIPFSVFWIELYYLLQAIWLQHWVSTFSFVFVALLALSCATAFSSILAVFLRLRTEDYHWWWRSFYIGAAPALYVWLYTTYFLRYMTLVSASSVAIYVFYNAIICIALSLLLGGVGFFASLFFVTSIYSNLSGID